jgi:hypothetical protein
VADELKMRAAWVKSIRPEPVPDPLPPPEPATLETEAARPRLKRISQTLLALHPQLDTVPLTDEAKRLLPDVRKVHPSADTKRIAATLHYLRTLQHKPASMAHLKARAAAQSVVREAPEPVQEPPAVEATPTPAMELIMPLEPLKPLPVGPPGHSIGITPKVALEPTPAGEAIEQALEALDAAERALASARAALITARADMVASIVRAVEDGVLEAIASATAKFRR